MKKKKQKYPIIIEQKDARYPIKVVFSNGRELQVVRQGKLKKKTFLYNSGCSIISEYEALQWLGKYDMRPLDLLKWHRKKTSKYMRGKLTVRGVCVGINSLAKKLGVAKYYDVKSITLSSVTDHLKNGALIVLEHRAPHTFCLVWDNGKPWLIDKGKCRVANLPVLVKRKNKTKTYGGMVVIYPCKKTDIEVAREVIAGKWGNDAERKKRLKKAGYNYKAVQNEVNKLIK